MTHEIRLRLGESLARAGRSHDGGTSATPVTAPVTLENAILTLVVVPAPYVVWRSFEPLSVTHMCNLLGY